MPFRLLERILPALYVLAVLLLLVAGTHGFFASDFFTLWGLQPKWVWATGHFFTSGAQLPENISYQSVAGSFFGSVLRDLSVTSYPDWGWGIFNTALIVLSFALTIRLGGGWPNRRLAVLFFLGLLWLHPLEFNQTTYGGYADLLGAVWIAFTLIAWERGRLGASFLGAAVTVGLKPTLWVWPAAASICAAILAMFGRDDRDESPFRVLPALVPGVTAGLAIFALSRMYPALSNSAAPMEIGVTNYTVFERVRLPVYLLMANNLAVGLVGILAFWRRREKPFWLLYWGTGFLLLCLHYTFIVGKGSTELFASIHRYTLPLVVPPLIAFSLDRSLGEIWTPQNSRAALVIFLLALVSRGLEEVDLLRRFPLARRFRLCNQSEAYCEAARAIREQATRASPRCAAWRLDDPAVFARYPHMPPNKLSLLKISFMALPTLVYTKESRVPEGAEVCSWP